MIEEDDDHENYRHPHIRGGRAAFYSDAPHFRKALAWFLGVFGTIISGVSVVGIVTLFSMREDVSVIKSTMAMQAVNTADRITRAENRLDNHDDRMNGIDGRVYVLEGKTLRGPADRRR